MDRVGLAGLTLHETNVEGLECLRRALQESPTTFPRELADALAASEVVLIATCNRVEIAYARESGHLPGPRDRALLARTLGIEGLPSADRLWLRSGREAVHHALRVAASLDSLVVGEAQILGQMREAFERARALGLVGEVLTPVFEAAMQVGKQVRSETDLARHPVSVVSLGVQHLAERLEQLGGKKRVALVGAGHMGVLVEHSLTSAGLELVVVANRTLAAAQTLAACTGARAMDLDGFLREPPLVDGIVSATGAPGHVLDAAALSAMAARLDQPLVAIDLAVPLDLEPGDDPRVEIVDLDALRARADVNRRQRMAAAELAEKLVERKLGKLMVKHTSKRVASLVAETLAETTDLFEHELARFLSGKIAHLSEIERRSVERWARTTFGRLAHAPVRAIKELATGMETNGKHEDEA